MYSPTGKDINARGNTRKHIKHALEDSLRRLKTDYIDLYFLHRFDDLTPLQETLNTLEDLIKEGKILYIGASNFAAWQVTKALGISYLNNWNRIECIQPMYNLVKRQAEVEILPMAKSENIGVITYSISLKILGLVFIDIASYSLFFYTIKRVSASFTTLVDYVVPVVGITAGYLLLDEVINNIFFITVLLIFVSLYLAVKDESRNLH